MFNQFNLLRSLTRPSSASSLERLSTGSLLSKRSLTTNLPFLRNFVQQRSAKVKSIALNQASRPTGFSKLGLLFGASLTTGVYLTSSSMIKNDAHYSSRVPVGDYHDQPFGKENFPEKAQRVKRKLNYGDLTYGSIFGLVLGIVIGKLSYVLALISFTTFVSLEFLENRGIISVPWNGIVKVGTERLNVKTLFFDNPSFKIAFFLSFVIAAWNI